MHDKPKDRPMSQPNMKERPLPQTPTIEEIAVAKPLDPTKRYAITIDLNVEEVDQNGKKTPFFTGSNKYHNAGMEVVHLIQSELIAGQKNLNDLGIARHVESTKDGDAS